MPAAMALRRLDEKAVSGAPVVDRGRIVGVITQRDPLVPTLVTTPRPRLSRPGTAIAWMACGSAIWMSGEPRLRSHGAAAGSVWTMIVHGVNRLPVVDQAGRSLGVSTRDDVLGGGRL